MIKRLLFLILISLNINKINSTERPLPTPEGEASHMIDLDKLDIFSQESFQNILEQEGQLLLAETVTTDEMGRTYYNPFSQEGINSYIADQMAHNVKFPLDPLNRLPIDKIYFYTIPVQGDIIITSMLDLPLVAPESLEELLHWLSPEVQINRYYPVQKSLSLYNLNLNRIPLKFFVYLNHFIPDLQNIDLSRNKLQNIPDTINLLTNLRELDLSNNQLKKLPELFLSNLITLKFYRNQLKELPALSNLISLKHFIAGENQLEELPDLNLENLELLMVEKNKLKKLPPLNIKLKNVHISNNELIEFPQLSELKNLEYLDASHNKLKTLPQMDQLTKLSVLNLSHNELKILPNLSHSLFLQNLDVDDNQLQSIPPTVGDLVYVRWLNVSNNPIETLPNLNKLDNLQWLYANNTLLKELPQINFKNLYGIQVKDTPYLVISPELRLLFQEKHRTIIE